MREVAAGASGSRAEGWLLGWGPGPFAAGAAVGLALVVGFLLLELALGRLELLLSPGAPPHLGEDIRIAVVLLLVTAYVPAATLDLARASRRTARALRATLRPGARELAEALHRLPAPGLRRAGLCGIAAYALLQLVIDRDASESFALLSLPPEAVVHRLIGAAGGWWTGRFAFALVATSRRLFRLGAHGLEVDVLATGEAAPLARQALRQTLLVLGLLSLLSLLFVDVAAAPGLAEALLAAAVAMGALATLCLLLPLLGARRAIAGAKAREIAWCNDALRRRRDALGADPKGDGRGLADLVAYKEHVAGVSEWLVDAPLLARFALYLALPLGSWLGGAFVERLLEDLLD